MLEESEALLDDAVEAEAPSSVARDEAARAASAYLEEARRAERAATRKILTFYPATSDRMTAFSRQKCHETRAAVKPSLPFLEWLASSSSPGWQLRGALDLGDEEPGAITGEEMRGKKKRKTSSSREDGSGGEEEEEERAGDAPAPAPPLVDAVAETAATSVEETTVIDTMIVEEMENEENTEEKQKDVEAEEEETRERMVLKTDSGTEVDLAKLKSAADVAPEMGGYLKKLQHQLSILLGGGSRSSD